MEKKEQVRIVNDWLKEVSKALDTTLQLNPSDICSFQTEENIISIEISEKYPMVHLYSPIIALPVNDMNRTALQAQALELNAFQILTRGGAIALAPGGGFLIYCFSISIEETVAEKFSHILGAFYETLLELKQILNKSS